jgi:hypothetical protein
LEASLGYILRPYLKKLNPLPQVKNNKWKEGPEQTNLRIYGGIGHGC